MSCHIPMCSILRSPSRLHEDGPLVGLASAGNHVGCLLRELDNQITVFLRACVFCGCFEGARATSYCVGWETLDSGQGEISYYVMLNGETVTTQCESRGCLWKWRYQVMKQLIGSCHPSARYSLRFVQNRAISVGCSSPLTRLA